MKQTMKRYLGKHKEGILKTALVAGTALGIGVTVAMPAKAATDLDTEIANMKKVATALGDICTGITNALMVVIGIHYSGKFIKYALG